MTHKFDIITFGSAVIDAFLETGLGEKNNQICMPLGSKLVVDEIWFSTGGGGTNTAVAFSKFGFKTGFIGKLGKDENANTILRELKKEKVDFLGARGDEPTGFSAVIDSKKKTRTILTYRGANDYLHFKEINLKKLNADWFYFSSMLGESLKTQEKLVRFALRKGIKIAFNPSAYLTKQGANKIKKILRNTEILILNDEEARDLVPRGDLFKGLHSLGPKIVCVTYGEKGNEVSDGKKIYKAISHKIKVVERTGAGDAFAAGFVSGMSRFDNIKKAAQIGTLNAESVIQGHGAKVGLLTWKKVLEKAERNPVKIFTNAK